MRASGSRLRPAARGRDRAGLRAPGRGLVPDPLRQHPCAVHRVGAGARAAVPAQQRPRLGDRRVRHAAALDQPAHRPRGGARPPVRAHPGDPAADRPRVARGDRHGARWASARSCSTATCCAPTAARAPPRSPAPTSRCIRRSPGWSRPRSCRRCRCASRSPPSPAACSTAWRCSTSTTRRTATPRPMPTSC